MQEGFSEESVDMLRKAGYRHIVTGPGADVPRPRPAQPLSKAFLSEISMLAGEGIDPGASSGLIIASRYPIVSAVGTPFPQNVCAGTDCLANKGVLTVRIALPGVAEPLEVTTSHLNAARRSGTAPAHHLYAYRQQVAAMEAFIQRQSRPGAARIVVGDFNLGSSDQRLSSFQAMINRLGLRSITAMGKHKDMPHCEQVGPCRGALPISPNVPLIDSLDWQIVADGRSLALAPLVRRVPFGREADGTMLSDHIGYSVTYRLTAR